MSKTINVKGTANWVYSLLGVWWVVAIPTFIVGCVIGFFNSLMIGSLYGLSFVVWVKTGEDRADKAKEALSSVTKYIKSWWELKPTFIE